MHRTLTLALLVALAPAPLARAQAYDDLGAPNDRPAPIALGPFEGLIQNVRARDVTTLNGTWRTVVDPYERGYYNYRFRPRPDGGLGATPVSRSESDLVEWTFEGARTLRVPGDWNSQREDLLWYEGSLWYNREVEYRLPPGRRLFLHVGGANCQTTAWMNGRPLGRHEGGFTPFEFEVTDAARDGLNTVVAWVSNRREPGQIPTTQTDWWNYGGLTRDVLLVEVPATFVRDYGVQLDPDRPDQIAGWVQLDGADAAGARVTVSVPELGLSETATADAEGYAPVSFAAPGLQRWRPGAPRRYTVVVEGAARDGRALDRVEDQIGFRTVSTRGTELLLNGEPVFLRGISLHEEAPLDARRAYSAEDAATLLGWARELDANYVRLAHYPHNAHMVEMADSLGLLVWSEIPVYWTIDWRSPATYANAERQLREMVSRDKNRAAVILWSVGNETPISEARTRFMTRLAETARSLDPTRLVTAALERDESDPYLRQIHDPLGAALDVVGVNQYVGWYDGLPAKIDSIRWETDYDKPHIVSEFGAGALQGLRGRPTERWTEDYQADLYRRTTAMIERMPFVVGVSPWILKDFRSMKRPLVGIQDDWNRKGLVSDRGEKKEAFYVLRDWYRRIEARGALHP